MELGGVGALHAAFLNESSTRGDVQRCVAGNPGPVEMTILWQAGIPCFQEKSEGSAVLRTFRGNVLRQGRSVAEGSAVSFPEPRIDTTPVLHC